MTQKNQNKIAKYLIEEVHFSLNSDSDSATKLSLLAYALLTQDEQLSADLIYTLNALDEKLGLEQLDIVKLRMLQAALKNLEKRYANANIIRE